MTLLISLIAYNKLEKYIQSARGTEFKPNEKNFEISQS